MNWSEAKHVAVIMPTWIGDVVMATPTLQRLRAVLPEGSAITALVRQGQQPLLEGLESVDAIETLDYRGLLGAWRGAARIRSLSPDTVLMLPNSFRSALTARLSGARHRIGYCRDGRGWLLSDARQAPDRSNGYPQVNWYYELVDPDQTEQPMCPKLAVLDKDVAEASQVLGDQAPAWVALVPAAMKPHKRWPSERFIAVANALHKNHGWGAIVVGTSKDADITGEIAAGCVGPAVDLAAIGCSLGGLKGLMQRAELAICIDTGPRHVAIGVGTPTISLFGPTDHRWTIIPDAPETRLLADPFLTTHQLADRQPNTREYMHRIRVSDTLHAINAFHNDKARPW